MGANTVEVTVTAENDATGVYTVTVTRGPDTTPPLLVSKRRSTAAALVLVYDENLDAVSQPAAAAFAVMVTDSAVDAAVAVTAAPCAVDVAGAEVTLTLTPPVRHDDTVTVAYTPGAAPLQDVAGNDAAAFNAGKRWTNDTAAAADTKLVSLALTADSSSVSLTPVFAAGTVTYTAFVPQRDGSGDGDRCGGRTRAPRRSVTPLRRRQQSMSTATRFRWRWARRRWR